MKKIFASVLCLAMVFSLVACGSKPAATVVDTAPVTEAPTVVDTAPVTEAPTVVDTTPVTEMPAVIEEETSSFPTTYAERLILTECDTSEEVESIIHFTIDAPDIDGYLTSYTAFFEEPEAEKMYYQEGIDEFGLPCFIEQILIRKIPGTDIDYYGVLDNPEIKTEIINGKEVKLEYEDGILRRAGWLADGYAYSLYCRCGVMSTGEIFYLISELR